ncbi:M28 family peptidase [soil metagenome]
MSVPRRASHSARTAVATLATALATGLAGCGSDAYKPSRAVHGELSGEAALAHVEAIVALGPRPPGSEALEETRRYLAESLAADGWVVERQTFEDRTPQGKITFVNLRARFPGGDTWNREIDGLLCSHIDSKLYESFVFVGANDGGSSTGLLLEMARVLAIRPDLARKIELVFFDGEEAYVSFTATDGLFGSRHYAKELRAWPPERLPKWAIVFDMVGDRDLNVRIPSNSDPRLTGLVLQAASDLGTRQFFGLRGRPIIDDHVPLANAGIAALNIIDLDYEPWHTPGDTLDKLSAESLEIVGQAGLLVVEKYLVGGVVSE